MRVNHPCVEKMTVVGDGFYADLTMDFSPHHNDLIGARGSGKTTALALLRFALLPEPPTEHVAATVKSGTVRVWVRTGHGVGYRVERSLKTQARVYDERGAVLAVSPRDVFPMDFYRHDEVEHIAKDHASQLALLDRFGTDEVREIETSIASILRELQSNAAVHRQLCEGLEDLRLQASTAATHEEKLKGLLEPAGADARAINDAHTHKALRERERVAFASAQKQLRDVQQKVGAFAADVARRLGAIVDEPLLIGPNRESMRALSTHLGKVAATVEAVTADVREACELGSVAIASDDRALGAAHAKQDAAYAEIVARSLEDSSRAEARTRLQQELAAAVVARKSFEASDAERRAVEERRREMLSKLSSLRDGRHLVRHRIGVRLSEQLGKLIRVSVTPAGDRSKYLGLVMESLRAPKTAKRLQVTDVATALVGALSPEELALLIRREDVGRLAERGKLDESTARLVISRLSESGQLYEIETTELADVPKIELLDGEYKESTALSTGQRCTTIVSLLFMDGRCPLAIDQPEDNLDGEFICETVVKSIVRVSESRQLVLATHNANVPIVGEASRVFVHKSSGLEGRIEAVGTVDDVKQYILTIMDGGEAAFLRRKKRYGY